MASHHPHVYWYFRSQVVQIMYNATSSFSLAKWLSEVTRARSKWIAVAAMMQSGNFKPCRFRRSMTSSLMRAFTSMMVQSCNKARFRERSSAELRLLESSSISVMKDRNTSLPCRIPVTAALPSSKMDQGTGVRQKPFTTHPAFPLVHPAPIPRFRVRSRHTWKHPRSSGAFWSAGFCEGRAHVWPFQHGWLVPGAWLHWWCGFSSWPWYHEDSSCPYHPTIESNARLASPMFFTDATLIRSVPFFSYTLKRFGCACTARSTALKVSFSKKPARK